MDKKSNNMNILVSNLQVFLYKTWKEKRYHWFRNTVNIILPVLFSLIILNLAGTPRQEADGQVTFDAFSAEELPSYFPTGLYNKVYYAPNNSITYEIIERVRQKLHIVFDRVEPHHNENEMEKTLHGIASYFAVIFHESGNKLDYKIRSKNNNFRTKDIYSRDLYRSYMRDKNEYFDSGFLALQYAIDTSYVEMTSGQDKIANFQFEHIPAPKTLPTSETQLTTFGMMMGIFFTIPFTYLVLLPLVEEKSLGFKEHLKIATPYSFLNDIAIFVVNIVQFNIMFILCLTVTGLYGIWMNVNIFLAYILCGLYVFSMMSYTFFISSVFDSEIFASIGAPILYFTPFIVGFFSVTLNNYLICIFPLNAFNIGVEILHNYKSSGHDFSWSNLWHTSYPGDNNFSVFGIYLLQFLHGFVYLFLYYYVSRIMPGKYGTPRRFLFIFENFQKNKINSCHEVSEDSSVRKETVSEMCDHLEIVVKIKHLYKMFKVANQQKTVVNNFSMSIYKNKITALLGHNGAGKTTTMNILTGMIPRTSGKIIVDGVEDVNKYRTTIGFCPQHNVLLSYLTCKQQVKFFGILRGLSFSEADKEADNILQKVNLEMKRNEFAENLSGGMKRKLSLANAIIGQTKVLILDEPTSGLDPESRRDVWDVLLKLKKDHTILITTHFMEEADVLGDKITIMENGEMIAFGSSIYLKNHYGSGYTLKLCKKDNFQRADVMEIISEHVDEMAIKESVEPIFAVTLPYKNLDSYPALIEKLENDMENLGIDSISITNTSLEEVFLKSSSEDRAIQSTDEIDSVTINDVNDEEKRVLIDMKNIFLRQFLAVLGKKFIYTKRNVLLTLTTISIPIIITIISFLIRNITQVRSYESLHLHFTILEDPICFLSIRNVDEESFVDKLKENIFKERVSLQVFLNEDLENILINESQKDAISYNDRIVSAIEFDGRLDTIKILYSNNILHSVGISLNIASNLMLNYMGHENNSISTTNSPSTRQSPIDSFTPFLYTEFISFGLMFYMLLYLQLPFIEYSTEFRKLQNIPNWLYWAATYTYDLLLHLLVCLIIYEVGQILDRDNVFTYGEHVHMFFIFLIYGMVQLVLIYIISQCFTNLNSAITFLSYFIIIAMISSAGLSSNYDNIKKFASAIFLLHILPDYAMKHSLKIVYENQKLFKIRQLLYPEKTHEQIAEDISDKTLGFYDFYLMMPIMLAVLWTILLLVVENMYRREAIHNWRLKLLSHIKMPKLFAKKNEEIDNECLDELCDADVRSEINLVASLIANKEYDQHSLIVSGLKKKYYDFEAVQNVSIAVKKGECFGLLGMNGAGKSTTFKMMTLTSPITEGEIIIDKQTCKMNEYEYKFKFGYCPQTDALMGFMTSYEILKYLCTIKGVKDVEYEVEKWLLQVDISKYCHDQIRLYSGGTKRKLNTALAMIGDPLVVFLDEPTTGVDPKSRRFVWKCIKEFQKNDQTIILTSHSMDECEELCNRLAIMAKGRLKCIGFIQKLKQRFGKGFSLLIKLKYNDKNVDIGETSNQMEIMKAEIENLFHCTLKDDHDGILHYYVGFTADTKWSEIFTKVIKLKEDYNSVVDSFSINETTLEDIFLNFKSSCSSKAASENGIEAIDA